MAAFVPPGIAGLLGEQSWEDRLREAAYTSPKGTRIKFEYEDVGREFDKRGTAFEFPGVNNSYVQQRGFSSRRYPLRCFLSGRDHDRIATAFEAALLEDGLGKLEHPLYGTVNVVPFGTVTRGDPLKTAANQSIIEVTFWTTTGAVYPRSSADPKNEILAAIAGFDVAAAQQFASSTDLTKAVAKANLKATIRKFLREVSANLRVVSDAVTSVNREFRDYQSLLNFGLDVLIGQPLQLAQQITNLVKAPARALVGITERLDAYARLAQAIINSAAATPRQTLEAGTALAGRTTRIANDFHLSDLLLMGTVAGAMVAIIGDALTDDGQPSGEPVFATKPQALLAADSLLTQFDSVVAWRDDGFEALQDGEVLGAYQVDTGGSYQALQRAAALTAGYLIEISFSLVPERRTVLEDPRTIIDLSAELYGSVDDRLDFVIESNGLVGDEILELPRNRMIRYYPS